MHPDWRAFLESRSAIIGDDGAARFPSAPAPDDEPACAVTDLSRLGIISVEGPEAEAFLQGQLSNDVRELSDTHSHLSSHCSPKGRMLASFRVLRAGERILLVLPRTQLDAVLKRLRMFLLRTKATISDMSDALVCIGVVGSCAEAALGTELGPLPEHANEMRRSDDAALIRVAGPAPRVLLIGPPAQAQLLWQRAVAEAGAVEADPDLWALHDIRAGLPTVVPETSDAFVPQMANMQLIDGVSFTKGCYTGQEVVARMQYLGKLKRRMYVAEVEADTPPAPGTPLMARGSTSEQGAGRVVDARPSGPGRVAMLVVAEISAAEEGALALGNGGPRLHLAPPPYGFRPE